jgi:hypothetical protein
MAATGLVSAAVIGVTPAIADHCVPGESTPSPSPSAQQRNRNQPDQNQQPDQEQQPDQNQQPDQEQQPDQGQQQDQGQPQDQGQQGTDQQQDADQQAPQGGGAAILDPGASPTSEGDGQTQAPEGDDQAQAPEEEQDASTFSRRGRPTRTATPTPTQSDNPEEQPSGTASPSPTGGGNGEEEACADLGPFPEDFIDIRQVPPRQLGARIGRGGSRGTFVSQCGRNENRHNNPDNFIVAPGVSNGAHHLHDYVGNLSTDAFSTDESLAAAGTTCRLGDKSTYFWPVLRDRRSDQNANDPDGNVGTVLTARAVQLQFRGNATSRVVPMPRFLRLITGDAKAATNGGANARAAWSCTGFQNRIATDKYPLCPRGSLVLRILDFPSCWDGQNTDSANHRTHVVFPGQNGACQSYAVDAFPEQKHNPVTDHADFANVMPDRLMRFVVDCINRGRRC